MELLVTVLSGINAVFLAGVAFGAGKLVQRLSHVEQDVTELKQLVRDDIRRRNGA